jgi:hypothetical protein
MKTSAGKSHAHINKTKNTVHELTYLIICSKNVSARLSKERYFIDVFNPKLNII